MINPNTPILIGIAQLKRQIESLEQSREPLLLMLDAAQLAEQDTGREGLLSQVQSVRVIRGAWRYDNPAKYLAEKIGVPNAETAGTLFGGNQVQSVVNHTAVSILDGKLNLVLICGAENGHSFLKSRKAGTKLPLTTTPGDYDFVFGKQDPDNGPNEIALGIQRPIQVYPLFENALRYHRGESLDTHIKRVSELWARFSKVAEGNPHAWMRTAVTAEDIRTPSEKNRRISFPYTKLLNSNMSVDMGAALIMCSVAKARALGVPESNWIYPHAGVEGNDHATASVRDNYYSSPAIRLVGQKLFEVTGTDISSMDMVDLYSCFPCAVQIAAEELGLDEKSQLTITGGLTFGGGPLNNYVMHSIARMAELLRESPGSKGLITANGGHLYKHAHGIYSSEPPLKDFQHANVQDAISLLPSRECIADYTGEVTVESYTVMYDKDLATVGYFACRTPDGARTWARTYDTDLMQSMGEEEFCGRAAKVRNTEVSVS